MRYQTLVPLLALTACGSPQIITVPEARHPGQLTVDGSATIELAPDCADLTMTVSAEDSRADLAAREAQQLSTTVLARLHAAGVADRDIQLSSISLQPYYKRDVREIHDYEAQLTVVVTTRDFSQLIPLVDAGAAAGVTGIASRFRRSDLDAQKRQVRELAIAAAKAKAEQTAHALGVKLGRVVSVAENQGGAMWSNAYFPAASSAAGASIAATAQPLTLDVTIGYELAAGVGT